MHFQTIQSYHSSVIHELQSITATFYLSKRVKMSEIESSLCGKCHKNINIKNNKWINCDGDCGKCFHHICSGLSGKELKKYSENKDKLWFCDICMLKRERRKSRLNDSQKTSHESKNANKNVIIQNKNNKDNSEINIIDVYNVVQKITNDIIDIKSTLKSLSDRIEEVTRENTDIMRENYELKDKISEIEFNMHLQKQQSLENNFEISGIPEEKNEDLVKKVINIINENSDSKLINENDIDVVYRKKINDKYNKNGYPPKICVRVNKNKVKRSVFENKKLILQKIESAQGETDLSIFINESLSAHFSFLLKQARDLRKKNKIKYAWVKNGSIFIKKTDESKTIKVLSTQHLIEYDTNDNAQQ